RHRPAQREPRQQHEDGAEREADVLDHRISVGALPDGRERTPSRHAARRRTKARKRSDQSGRTRARSAAFGPSCFAKKRRWPRKFSTYICPPCDAPPTCTTSAPGKNSTFHPARLNRVIQSTSSLNMKNASSNMPTASTASRRTSSAGP